MRDILKLTGDLHARLTTEIEALLAARSATRDILEARMKELGHRRDEEFKRIDQWAAQQKALVTEVFGAMLAEAKADLESNAQFVAQLGGEQVLKTRSGNPLRTLNKAAEAFAKAAE